MIMIILLLLGTTYKINLLINKKLFERISKKIQSSILLQLLLKPKFSSIEKIKTIGSTYMLASGLRPPGAENKNGVRFSLFCVICTIILEYRKVFKLVFAKE